MNAQTLRQAFQQRHRRVEIIVCEQPTELPGARSFTGLRQAVDHVIEVSRSLEVGVGYERSQSAQIVGERSLVHA
jgi:hypothetical protein